jgi:dynein heavy chain
VLSVIAQQILTIQKAKREGAKRFVFEGTTLNMRASCNIFITMNPGYAGRSELPDNLKALFRPVAMMVRLFAVISSPMLYSYTFPLQVPDYALISEIILFSYGFLEARTMARKVVQVLRLASEQLSSQSHYDYGMRAVKTILVAAGNLRRRLDDWAEDAITLRAILDANVPKFTSADIPLFRGIVTDLFPTTVLPQANDALLRFALTTVCEKTGLSPEPVFMEKCIQLYETVAVRHGLMLVGATLSGKSTVLKTLAKSLTGLAKKEWAAPAEIGGPDVEAGMSVPPRNVRTKAINPKSLALSHLFGTFDENTHEWTDGVLANAVRNFASDLTMAADLKWLVFDGPVDAVWIESMNTVLDDNKKLCLNSGEIVKITPEMTMMFEVDNLEQASPATVSRCGMVYLEPDQLGWKPLAKSWLGMLPDTDGLSGHKEFLLELLDSMVPSLLALVTKKLRSTSVVPELSMLTSMLSLFGAVLSDSGIVTSPDAIGPDGNVCSSAWRENLDVADLDAINAAERSRLEAMFIYSALWSIGGNLDSDSRHSFHTAFHRLLTGEPLAEFHVVGSYNNITPPSPRPVSTAALPPVGAHRTLFDFQLDCAHLATPLAALQVRSNVTILAPERHSGTSPREAEAPEASPVDVKSPLQSPATAASNAAAHAEAAAALAAQRHVLFRTVTDTNIRWTSWAEQLVSVAGPSPGSDVFPIASGIEFTDIIVPTVETVSRGAIINQLVQNRCHVMLTGVTGTGKSVAITRGLLPNLDPQRWMSAALQFSARTSSEQTQSIIDSRMSKRRVGVFGPPLGKRAVIFVDDLNMPAPDTYGSQAPIELLRQWMDYQGWYDRNEKGKPFRRLVDLQFIAAMASGRGTISPRYVRHFNTVGFVPFDDTSLRRIFGSVVHWFFSGSVASEVTATAHQLVAATVDLYVSLAKALRPTPAKSHYTFNLRDVGRVFQGITMAQADTVSSPEHMIRLWGHECDRVFADRLLENSDIQLFSNTLAKQLQVHCNVDWVAVKTSSAGEKESALTFANFLEQSSDAPASKGKSTKGKSSKAKAAQAQKPYVQVASSATLNSVLKSYLDSYNTTAAASQKLDLVLFGAAREHVARIARCLSQPGGHALLLGVGGSGRRSLTKLAAYIEQCVVFEVEAGKSYTMNDWKEDAKGFMMRAGLENKQFVLFMPETSIVHEAMLEDINNVLNTGEIPNLLNNDDQGQIIAAIGNEAKHAARAAIAAKGGDTSNGVNLSNAEVLMYFRKKCARNLHVVLAFSPLSQSFRPRLRAFPSLVNCCYIDFFHNWPAEALTSVAHRVLGGNPSVLSDQGKPALQTALVAAGLSPSIVYKASDVEDDEKLLDAASADSVVAVCVEMQVSATALSEAYAAEQGRKNYVTPTTYLQLLKLFASLLASKKKLLSHQEMRYVKGVQSIESTEELVATMQAELQALQPTLERAKEETNAMMVDIEKQQKEADVTEALCEQEKKICLTTAAEAQKMTDECQADLAEALPALEAAVEALKTLTKSDLVLVKSMQKPPNGVRIVMETVCILLGVAPEKVKGPDGKNVNDYWDAAKKHLLSDPKFMTRLLKYDKDSLSDEIAAALAPYITDPEFQPDKVAKASSAAEGLCKFVRAMCTYQRVAKTVEPKRKKLAEASAQLAEAQAILKAKEERLAEVKAYVAKLKRQLQEANDKKRELERQVNDCIVKLDRAQQLIAGLGGEKGRWRESAADFARRSANLLGDMLLSAGITTYLGAFSSTYRARAIESWTVAIDAKGLPRSTAYSLRGALADDVTVRMWTANNLPADSFSIDSASMMFNSAQWPLLIDPQRQANRWIRKMEAEFTTTLASMFAAKAKGGKGDKGKDAGAAIRVLRMNSSGFNRAIQQAVQLGMPVLIENVGENVDPYLDPLLLHQVTKNGMMMNVRLGEDVVEYNPSFRLYMTTELANPHYSPETKAKVNVLNFAATVEGLADQMLGIVVAAESPDLEAQREALVRDTAATLSQIAAIEDNILRLLAASEGDILEDENLISTLKSSRVTSEQAAEKMVLAERTQKRISAIRVEYTPVAQRAATLYFVVACLAGVEPMYQFSLEWFIRLFLSSIAAAPASKKQMQGRLKSVIDTFTQNLYLNVCRSLFEKDKLLFSMILTIRILESEGFILEEEARYFLTGNTALELVKPNPAKSAGSTLAELSDVTRVEEGNESDEDEDEHSDAQSTTGAGVSWLTDAIWGDLVGLSKLSALAGIDEEVANNLRQWFAVVSTAFDPLTIIKDLVGHDEHGGDPLEDSHGADSTARAAGAGTSAVMALKRHNSVLPRAMTKANINRLGSFIGGKDTGRSSADPSKTRWSHLTAFHHLLLLRCLRPDKIVPALQQFISDNLGRQFVEVPTFDLQQSFNDSACDAPLVFVLSPGADPTAELLRLADMKGFGRKLKIVSLGQGQGPIAEAAIAEAVDSGLWVCLQNCHLATSWMSTLEHLVEEITADRTHPDFRLWLTSMPDKAFPVSVLQRSIKMTNEPPKGIRANMLGSYLAINEPWFEDCAQPRAFKKLLFGLCFFHAVVQERRRFGPLGWNETYNFTDADLSISISQLRMFLDEGAPAEAWTALAEYRGLRNAAKGISVSPTPGVTGVAAPGSSRRSSIASSRSRHSSVNDDEETVRDPFAGIPLNIPFPALQYLVTACNYGGRVTDDKDARTLDAVLRGFYSPEILEDGYRLSEGGTYFVPSDGPLASYVDYVKALPLSDGPEIFGLHENAAITTALTEMRALLSTGLAVLPAGTSKGSKPEGEANKETAETKDASSTARPAAKQVAAGGASAGILTLTGELLAKLPASFDVEDVARKFPVRHEQSMNTVLVQELIRYNKLLGVVRSSLTQLSDAVQGLVVMSAQLDAMATALQQNRVPATWHAASYPSLKPLGSWIVDLCNRITFFETWVRDGPPAAFWISGFFFPQSFLTGQLQNYARKTQLPIDTIEFDFSVSLTVLTTNPYLACPLDAPYLADSG